ASRPLPPLENSRKSSKTVLRADESTPLPVQPRIVPLRTQRLNRDGAAAIAELPGPTSAKPFKSRVTLSARIVMPLPTVPVRFVVRYQEPGTEMLVGMAKMGKRGSICCSVFIMGVGAPGGVRPPWARRPDGKMQRMSTATGKAGVFIVR